MRMTNWTRTLWQIALAGAVLILADRAFSAQPLEVARVVGVRGSVVATAPGEPSRVLRFDSPVYVGDEIVTARGAALGLLSGSYYIGLDEATTATIGLADTAAPDVEVLAGRARLLDSGGGAAARVSTPGLLAANAGTDTDVFAFPEKGGLVSMICPNEGAVRATRAGEALAPAAGDCAVAKRGEALYAAHADHPSLGVLAETGGFDLAGDPTARLGAPLPPVALGLAAGGGLASDIAAFSDDPRLPCDSPSSCETRGAIVPDPPTNPPMPGDPCAMFPQLCMESPR